MGPPIVTTLMNEGELITTHSITSKTRTVETVTVSLTLIYFIDIYSDGFFKVIVSISIDIDIDFVFQYQKEHDGLVETRVEQKITVQSDGDPIDHDKALAEAIQV